MSSTHDGKRQNCLDVISYNSFWSPFSYLCNFPYFSHMCKNSFTKKQAIVLRSHCIPELQNGLWNLCRNPIDLKPVPKLPLKTLRFFKGTAWKIQFDRSVKHRGQQKKSGTKILPCFHDLITIDNHGGGGGLLVSL